MTLGRFALIVGAPPRWVQNAIAQLGERTRYTEDSARRLGLAREIREVTGMSLRRAWRIAREALEAWPAKRTWVTDRPGGSVRVFVDVERYLSGYAARLSLARARYAERRRGRIPRRPRDPLAAARAYGVDVDLLRESLRRSPAERLRQLDADVEFVRGLRVVDR